MIKIPLVSCATHKNKVQSIIDANTKVDIHKMYQDWFVCENNQYTTYDYETGMYITFLELTFTPHKPDNH
jgi:hypothetical protein